MPILTKRLLHTLLMIFDYEDLAVLAVSCIILQLWSALAFTSQQLLGKLHSVPTRSNTKITKHCHFSFSSALHSFLLF